MYIIIRDSIYPNRILASIGHAALGCYLKYQDDPCMQEWQKGTFHKVICSANDKQFSELKQYNGHVVITESRLDNAEVAMAFHPRKDEDWPKSFKFLPLYNIQKVLDKQVKLSNNDVVK